MITKTRKWLQKLIKHIRFSSFKRKLAVALIATAILPLLLTFAVALSIIFDYFETNATNSLEAIAKEKQQILDYNDPKK